MWTLEFVYRYWTSDFKISIIYARIYWLFHVKAKKSENKTKLNGFFFGFFKLPCFTLWLSLYGRLSFVRLIAQGHHKSWLLKEEIFFNFPTQNLRARKGSNQRPCGKKKKKSSPLFPRLPQRQCNRKRYSEAGLAKCPASSASPLSPYLRRYFSTSGIKLVYPGP